MEEIWKDVVGYEGLYSVSNFGNVRSDERIIIDSIGRTTLYPSVILKFMTKGGYFNVNLYKDRKLSTKIVHRLVAQAFIPNPENKPEINHIDLNKTNNMTHNLEWCTSKENSVRWVRVAKPHFVSGYDKPSSKTVVQLDLDFNFINEFGSIHDVYNKTGFQRGCISKSCRTNNSVSYGFRWMYKNDYDKLFVEK